MHCRLRALGILFFVKGFFRVNQGVYLSYTCFSCLSGYGRIIPFLMVERPRASPFGCSPIQHQQKDSLAGTGRSRWRSAGGSEGRAGFLGLFEEVCGPKRWADLRGSFDKSWEVQ